MSHRHSTSLYTLMGTLLVGGVAGCSADAQSNDEEDISSVEEGVQSEGRDLFDKETFGGNGRTCLTCHSKTNGTLTMDQIAELHAEEPDGRLFASIDADDGASDFTRLLTHGTFRIPITLNPKVRDKDNPTATTVVINRGTPSNLNAPSLNTLFMADGRETDLSVQALNAVHTHYENTVEPTQAQLDALEDFQKTDRFFSSDALRDFADGGAPPQLPTGTTDAEQRGARFFAVGGQCTLCHSGPMLNTTDEFNLAFGAGSLIETASVGRALGPLLFSTGTNPMRTWEVDVLGDGFNGGDDIVKVSEDLGVGFHSGRPEDMNQMRTPTLWNVKNTAPYFRSNSAKTLEDVATQYEQFFGFVLDICDHTVGGDPTDCTLDAQEKSDIVAFLKLL